MTTVTLDLERVSGLDALAYFIEFGQHVTAPSSPYRDLEAVVAGWADGGLSSHDRVILGWLLNRQAGSPALELGAYAAGTRALTDTDDDPAPDGAGLDAPAQHYDGLT